MVIFFMLCTSLVFGLGISNSSPNNISTDETEDEDVNKEYIEETNRDAVIIAAAKLVATDAVPKVSICLLYIIGSVRLLIFSTGR